MANHAILSDVAQARNMSVPYLIEGTSHLLDVLEGDPEFRHVGWLGDARALVGSLPPSRRLDSIPDPVQVFARLDTLGVVGAALFWTGAPLTGQVRTELGRFLMNPNEVTSSWYTFYLAGSFAMFGHQIDFIDEQSDDNVKTPDFSASRDGRILFVEATAARPPAGRTSLSGVGDLVHGAVDAKRKKFEDRRFAPGLIAVDVSVAWSALDENGHQPQLKPRNELLRDVAGGRIYPLYEDSTFFERPENRDSIVAAAASELAAVDRSRFHVSQLLVTVARSVYQWTNITLRARWHRLFVSRDAEVEAAFALSPCAFSVDQCSAARPVETR